MSVQISKCDNKTNHFIRCIFDDLQKTIDDILVIFNDYSLYDMKSTY